MCIRDRSPSFKSSTTSYKCSVPSSTSSVAIYTTTTEDNATVKIYQEGDLVSNTNKISLAAGSNEFRIVVTAPNFATKTYKLEVNRGGSSSSNNDDDDASSNAYLSDLTVDVYKRQFWDYAENGDFSYDYLPAPGTENRLEGFLFPETYEILPDWTEREIIDAVSYTHLINPMPVITGMALYPKDALDHIQQTAATTVALDALEIARAAHNPKGVNVALIGVLSTMMDIPETIWLDVLKEKVPAKFLEANLQVFQAGRNAVG